MRMDVRVSVIIPAYNASIWISRAIESVLRQTFPVLEIIVVDDGSTDDTTAVVMRHSGPISLIRQGNRGPAAARNNGARLARGNWFAFLDADDCWLPEKVSRQIHYTKDSAVGMVHCRAQPKHGGPIPERISFERLWKSNCIVNSTVLVRATAFNSLGGFDESRDLVSVEDYNLWLRLAAAGWAIATCPEDLCEYTPRGDSLSRQTERFAMAHLANVEGISRHLQLSSAETRNKLNEIYSTYGRAFFYQRHMRLARRFLRKPLLRQPTLSNLAWWLGTWVPIRVLNLRRWVFQQLAERRSSLPVLRCVQPLVSKRDQSRCL